MGIKVLMFGWEFPPYNSGGLGVACKGLTKALSEKNIDVTFVLPRKVELEDDNIHFVFGDTHVNFKIRAIQSNITPYETSSYLSKMSSVSVDSRPIKSLAEEVLLYEEAAERIAMQEEFDVIHAHDWLSFGAGIRAKNISGKPLLAHIHATEFDRGGNHGVNKFVYDLEKRGFEKADVIVSVSNYTKQMVVDKYNIPEKKIEVVHNGVDTDEISTSDTEKIEMMQDLKKKGYKLVLFLGRLTIQKNPDGFLRAAKEVLKYNKKVLFIFAGSGDMEGQLIEETAKLGLSDRVLFTGFVRGKEKDKLFRSADLFVMPSTSEPFGIVPLEALANGTPALISKQSGIAEILTHSLTVNFWDETEMANKILAVLEYDSLKKSLTENGNKQMKEFTWKKAADKIINIYDSLLVHQKKLAIK